ncbi:hypothetical protein POTOM_045019 [Populus tomentosa]|uniref:Uncharacterized protein n=1 Tax=Populus tomentosa TaxID=118781 RepID=A0A8X7YD02_POPTO|nr:hypothetical protein POTOM_045019 [Populus tomentosa]
MSTVEKSIGIPSLNVGSGEYSLADIPRADIGGRDFYPGSVTTFTGEIPPEFGSLGEIHALNLSHNNLTGSIPATLSNLKQIESLDLSHNNLNGGKGSVYSIAFCNF